MEQNGGSLERWRLGIIRKDEYFLPTYDEGCDLLVLGNTIYFFDSFKQSFRHKPDLEV